MEALVGLVEQETQFVRAGKLRDAAKLEATKSDLARLYLADTLRVKSSQGYLSQAVPDTMTTPTATRPLRVELVG